MAITERLRALMAASRAGNLDLALLLVGAAAWIWALAHAAWYIMRDAVTAQPSEAYLYDWHVYLAGAYDLVDRALYYQPLGGPWKLPVDEFNQPPLAAAWALLLAPLGTALAGTVWQVLITGSLFVSAFMVCRIIGVSAAWGGIALALYSYPRLAREFFEAGVQLANNTWLVLAMVVLFAWAHQRGFQRAAGVALGLAAATKLWPAALLVVSVRSHRWREVTTAVVVVVGQALFFLVWLRPEVVPHAVAALLAEPVAGDRFWVSSLRELDWWPRWGGLIVGAALLAIPATGNMGLGLGLLAGVSMLPNIWHHYLPVLFAAFALIGAGLVSRRAGRHVLPAKDYADRAPD